MTAHIVNCISKQSLTWILILDRSFLFFFFLQPISQECGYLKKGFKKDSTSWCNPVTRLWNESTSPIINWWFNITGPCWSNRWTWHNFESINPKLPWGQLLDVWVVLCHVKKWLWLQRTICSWELVTRSCGTVAPVQRAYALESTVVLQHTWSQAHRQTGRMRDRQADEPRTLWQPCGSRWSPKRLLTDS